MYICNIPPFSQTQRHDNPQYETTPGRRGLQNINAKASKCRLTPLVTPPVLLEIGNQSVLNWQIETAAN